MGISQSSMKLPQSHQEHPIDIYPHSREAREKKLKILIAYRKVEIAEA